MVDPRYPGVNDGVLLTAGNRRRFTLDSPASGSGHSASSVGTPEVAISIESPESGSCWQSRGRSRISVRSSAWKRPQFTPEYKAEAVALVEATFVEPVAVSLEADQLRRSDERIRAIERMAQLDRKTVRRYVAVATELGIARNGGEAQLTDEFIGSVVEVLRPHRRYGHGQGGGHWWPTTTRSRPGSMPASPP